jgi:hypothetical protein
VTPEERAEQHSFNMGDDHGEDAVVKLIKEAENDALTAAAEMVLSRKQPTTPKLVELEQRNIANAILHMRSLG